MIKTVILKSGKEIVAEVEELMIGLVLRLNKPYTIENAFIPQSDGRALRIMVAPQFIPMWHSLMSPFVDISKVDLLCDPQETNAMLTKAYIKHTTGLDLEVAQSVPPNRHRLICNSNKEQQ